MFIERFEKFQVLEKRRKKIKRMVGPVGDMSSIECHVDREFSN